MLLRQEFEDVFGPTISIADRHPHVHSLGTAPSCLGPELPILIPVAGSRQRG